MSDENGCAGLREEIRRAGHSLMTTRFGMLVLAAGVVALALRWVLHGGVFWEHLAPAILLASGIGAAAVWSLAERKRIRRGLRGIPRAAREQLLRSLCYEAGGVREVAERFWRETCEAAELAPAAPPPGRGDELAGA